MSVCNQAEKNKNVFIVSQLKSEISLLLIDLSEIISLYSIFHQSVGAMKRKKKGDFIRILHQCQSQTVLKLLLLRQFSLIQISCLERTSAVLRIITWTIHLLKI